MVELRKETFNFVLCVRLSFGLHATTQLFLDGFFFKVDVRVRRGTGKSLARPTSRCHRTESIVSLERGVFHVPNCKIFLDTEAERKHVRRRALFQQHRDASCHQVFFPLQGKAPNEIYAILTETLGEHAPLYATIKKWVAQFNPLASPSTHGIDLCFFTCCRPVYVV